MPMPKSPEYFYTICCCDLTEQKDLENLDTMVEDREEITFAEMLAHCDGLLDWGQGIGLEPNELRDDQGIFYYKSHFGQSLCFFADYSAFQFIWVKPDLDFTRTGRFSTEPKFSNGPRRESVKGTKLAEPSPAYAAGKRVTRGGFAQERFAKECGLQVFRATNHE